MTVTAERLRSVGDGDTPSLQERYDEVFAGFVDIARALNDDRTMDELLHIIGSGMCRLIGVSRSSVYLRERKSGLFRGKVGHAGNPIDAAVQRLTAGGAADRFTQEILATRAPVLIDNARRDHRPVRQTMREWDVRAMLGVPMVIGDEVLGLVFLDNEDLPHHYGTEEQHLAAMLANLAGVAILQAQRTADIRRAGEETAAENRTLRQSAAVEERLREVVADGGGLDRLAEGIATLSGRACAIHRVGDLRRLAGATGTESEPLPVLLTRSASADPAVLAAVEGLQPGRATPVGPFPGLRTAQRFLVARIDLRDTLLGYVVMPEHGRRLNTTDGIVARRAANLAALEMGLRQRDEGLAEVANVALARDLLGVTPPAGSLAKRAAAAGMDLESVRHVVCHITPEEPGAELAFVAGQLVGELRDRGISRVLGLDTDDGVALILGLARGGTSRAATDALKGPVSDALRAVGAAHGRVAAFSLVCRTPEELPGALEQCRRIASYLATYGTDDGCISAEDVGRGRMFLASAPADEMRRFADETLGPILDPSGRWAHLVVTLVAYFEEGRNMRGTAARMNMHENTVRYRLGKVATLTGLDVTGNPDDELTAQIAVSVLRVEGRLPDGIDQADGASAA